MTDPNTKRCWADELHLPRAGVRTIFLLPFVIAAIAHLILLTNPGLFWQLTRKAHWFGPVQTQVTTIPTTEEEEHRAKNAWRFERHFGPNHIAKIGVEVVTAILAFQISRQARRRGRRALANLYLVVAIGVVVVSAEEARWGQSFGLNLFPEKVVDQVQKTNLQGEFTIHNQPRVQRLVKAAMTVLALYGFLSGCIVSRWRRDWLKEKAFYFFIPHPVFIPGFAFVLFYTIERVIYKLVTGSRVSPLWRALQEPTELIAVMTLMLFCWVVLRTVKSWPLAADAR
jgi:hypothetical protein